MKSGSSIIATKSGKKKEEASNYRYTFDVKKLEDLRVQCPWKDDPKYFRMAAVSPSAVIKILMHCQAGVEKGIRKGGRPVEVMGLLFGRPDPITTHTLVVTDVHPLSVEGFETSVVADSDEVTNEMIRISESCDRTAHERVIGWYHSHPFDLGKYSNCYLSATDLQTQLNYQRIEDPSGNPFLAIVVDPLRSTSTSRPEMRAFRAYPPEYSPAPHECPDGMAVQDEKTRLELWGKCWDRYYELDIEYYMSSSARNVMGMLTRNYLWMSTLGTTPTLSLSDQSLAERVRTTAERIQMTESSIGTTSSNRMGRRNDVADSKKNAEESEAFETVVELAKEQLQTDILQTTKLNLF